MPGPLLQQFRTDRSLAAMSAWVAMLALLAQLLVMPLLPAAAAADEHAICFAVADGASGGGADGQTGDRPGHCPFCRLTPAAVLPPPPAMVVAPVAFVSAAPATIAVADAALPIRVAHTQPRAPPSL
ncbi:MAG: DUF2946 family protein [Rhodospirillales bacterium]